MLSNPSYQPHWPGSEQQLVTRARRIRAPWFVWPVIAGALIGAALYYSVPAHADPSDGIDVRTAIYAAAHADTVCALIDDSPTESGVFAVIDDYIRPDGFTNYQGGEIVGLAVDAQCPRYRPLLREIINEYVPPAAPAPARTGVPT